MVLVGRRFFDWTYGIGTVMSFFGKKKFLHKKKIHKCNDSHMTPNSIPKTTHLLRGFYKGIWSLSSNFKMRGHLLLSLVLLLLGDVAFA